MKAFGIDAHPARGKKPALRLVKSLEEELRIAASGPGITLMLRDDHIAGLIGTVKGGSAKSGYNVHFDADQADEMLELFEMSKP